jgi:hypothetical protein
MPDAEIEAMQTLADVLDGLPADQRQRVIRWAADRFDVALSAGGAASFAGPSGAGEGGESGDQPYRDFVDLFDAVGPRTDIQKALTGAYWLQVVQGAQSWPSQSVNNLLKDTGHGVGNIAHVLASAQNRKPAALVRQVSKSGRARQARKTYKLTTAGVAAVRGSFAGGAVDTDDDG